MTSADVTSVEDPSSPRSEQLEGGGGVKLTGGWKPLTKRSNQLYFLAPTTLLAHRLHIYISEPHLKWPTSFFIHS